MTYSIFTVSKPLAIVSLCDMVDDQQNPQNQFRWLKQDDVYKCDIYIYFPHLLLDYVHRQPNWNTQLDQLGPLNPKVAGARRDLGGCSIPVSCKYMVRHAAECYPFSIYCEKNLYGYCVCVFRLDVQNWIRPQVEDTTLRCASVQASTPGAPLVADGRRSALRPNTSRFNQESFLPGKPFALFTEPFGNHLWVPPHAFQVSLHPRGSSQGTSVREPSFVHANRQEPQQ